MQTETTTTTKEPAKALSPAELAEHLMALADRAVPWEMADQLQKAREALGRVQARVDRVGEKKLRILRAKSIEEAKGILDENPADVNLKTLCQKRSGWKALEMGASDETLKQFLGQRGKGWPDYRPQPHKVPSAQVGYSGRSVEVWVDPDKGPDGNAHLSGQKLVDAVRRVMKIPKPAAPKPAPAKKAVAKPKGKPKPTPAAKAGATGEDDAEEAGGDIGDPPQAPAPLPSMAAKPKAAKPEAKRVSGKTRAQMNAILRQNGRAELERKRALHAPLCPSEAPSFQIIDAILDRMYGPLELAGATPPAPHVPLLSVAALARPQTPMPRGDDDLPDAPPGEASPGDDPYVDGRGIYVQGVREIVVRGGASGDKTKIVIRVARGADGLYRTGHLLEFVGALFWQADSDEPVKASGQAVEAEHYAIKARANILINVVKAAPSGVPGGGAWTPEQRATYGAAIKALEQFIEYNPACKPAGSKKAKAMAAGVI